MDSQGQVTDDAATIYEEFFVPALFAEWAPRVVDAAELEAGASALDVACGTGVLAREAARRVGSTGVTAIDVNDGMLAVARRLEPRIAWVRGRAEELPFEESRYDAVLSQFGLMFFDDRVRALREMWRVLRPGGRMVIAVWGSLDETPGYASMVDLLRRLFGDAIADELRAPFALGDRSGLRALFERAGIPGANIRTPVGSARFPSIEDWVYTDVRGWTLADKIDDLQYAQLLSAAQETLSQYVLDGGVCFASPAHVVTARKP